MRAARLFTIVGGMLLIGGLGTAGYHWSQSPANGTNTTLASSNSASVLGSQTKLTDFTSDDFTTQIPSTLVIKSRTENSAGPIVASYLLTSASHGRSDQLAITYGTLGTNQLSEIAAVKLRLNHPEQYKTTSVSGLADGGLAFSRQDSYETSTFWQHGNRYVAVVASGTADTRADMDEALHAVLSNWQWR